LLSEHLLRELYVDRGMTTAEIADQVGCSRPTVSAALRRHDIATRPAVARPGIARRPKPRPSRWEGKLTRESLEELYIRQGLSSTAIAAQVGLPDSSDVLHALRHFGIPAFQRSSRQASRLLTSATLQQLYIDRQLSEAAIGRQFGCGAGTVRRALRKAGIARRRGGEKDWSGRPPLTEELLRELYVNQRLSKDAIARSLHHSPFKVRQALADHGISQAHRGAGPTRFQPRREFPVALLEELYVDQELTSQEIAEMLEVDPGTVLDRLHEAGLPVRRAGSRAAVKGATPAEVALERLYADPTVTAILDRFGIARRSTPFLAADVHRAPSPRLDPEILRALYVDAGLSSFRIELLTGVDNLSVLAQLHEAGIPVRRSTSPRSRSGLVDAEVLGRLYVERGLSIADTAAEIGMPSWTVARLLRDHGIPRRPPGQRSDRPSNRFRAKTVPRRPSE
jgi:transposase-like protein/AraC-like DNA-binding protein/plasmid maintenance system antidote protein VapI